ncbi:MAG TPA: AraC family transcriptional regulator [Terracidiphilus sp.]|nr:AraC family transcriptional regulator [Terracidiphilus sp.]
MDPLSDVLSVLKPRGTVARGFDIAGDWSIRFGPHEGIKCYALISGQCWLVVEGVSDPVHLQTGDCFLLPRGLPFRLASDIALPPVDAHTIFKLPLNGGVATWNGGGDCFGVGGHFTLTGNHARILLNELPPVVHIRSEADRAELRWCLERMSQEVREQRPGAALVGQQLATMMLIQALRLHLEEGLKGGVGWLFALADKQLNAAITAIHDEPAHRWTLQKLAARSGMSRSIFAQKFKATVGTSPMEYLTRWRMFLAADRLENSDEPIASIAQSLGYESESAFSKAFRRVMACSPRQYRRSQIASPHPDDESAAGRLVPVAL